MNPLDSWSPGNIIIFGIQNGTQSYAGKLCIQPDLYIHYIYPKKDYLTRCAFPVPMQCPPPEFPIGSKISGHWTDLHFYAPIYLAKGTESIPLECF